MSTNKKSPLVNFLENVSSDLESLPDDIVREELESSGINHEAALARTSEFIKKRLKMERTSWMKVADSKREQLNMVAATIRAKMERTPSGIAAAWDAFISSLGPKEGLAFRNKTDLSLADKEKILDDLAQLDEENSPND